MALGSTQPVVKADNLPPYRAVVMNSGSLNFLEPSGACTGLLWDFTFLYGLPGTLVSHIQHIRKTARSYIDNAVGIL